LGQIALFTVVVCIPIWRTGRMSYVDIGWPWGLVLLGIISFCFSEGYWLRSLVVSSVVILIGLRMGLGALKMWRLGFLKKEFPRYQYQRIVWKEEGKNNTALALQIDAIAQGLANASFLAFPVFIIASNGDQEFSVLEIVGLVIWILAFSMESIADFQKVRFLKEMKRAGKHRQVCNVGLWKYCRHPNYFAEWMVWNGLVIAAIPSWLSLKGFESEPVWLLLGIGLLLASKFMYTTLVYTTGAVPSEYYSVQKRPDYKDYQQQTNRFFPGPRKR
jgi:steroid 5-alpha reductase family enzyme